MKNLLRHLVFVLIFGCAFAQTKLPDCPGSDVNVYRWNNCFGTASFANGDKYVGEFKNGAFNGQGAFTYANGQKLVGWFEGGRLNGDGTATLANGNRYVGEWKEGRRHGAGIEYDPNGAVITSGFYKEGEVGYRIDIDKNRFTFNIQIVNSTSEIESQLAKNNLPPCKGSDSSKWMTCTYTNGLGERYSGEFRYGMFHGAGTYIYKNGEKYIGEWESDKPHGQGVLFSSSGVVLNEGLWRYGKFLYAQKEPQPLPSNNEVEKLRAEAEEAKRKQGELESQLRLAPQPVTQQSSQSNTSSRNLKRIALVIGNAAYNSAPLKNPLNDAADISTALRQSGFEVIDQRNATLQEMTRGIREFGDKLLKSDVGLVYYSGHGLEVKGRNYLLPVNASMIREDEIAFQAIDANLILEKMNTAKKSVNILIVDACRDNHFARSFRSVNRGLAQMDAPTGTIVSFSTAPGKTASDGDGRNSPFTKNLVKAMMRADMPIEAMFKEVRKSVVEETKGQQTPWESSSLIGDFYFKVSK